MRKILFRGKRKEFDRWVHGMLNQNANGFYQIQEWSKDFTPELGLKFLSHYEVNPKTIGQFTGLTDKNGKEVFESDIVRCQEFENNGLPSLEFGERELFTIDELKGRKEAEYISEIFYDEANFYVDEDGSCEVPLCCFFGNMKHSSRIYELEVIGNKYDNPELLNQ